MIELIPAQNPSYRVLRYALKAGDLLLLNSVSGRDRTTVLKKLHEETGGAFINSKDFIERSGIRSLSKKLFTIVCFPRYAITRPSMLTMLI